MALNKNQLNLKTLAIPRFGKLVSIDFPMYENIFSQFMENRWGYPYYSHSWILRDYSCEEDYESIYCNVYLYPEGEITVTRINARISDKIKLNIA